MIAEEIPFLSDAEVLEADDDQDDGVDWDEPTWRDDETWPGLLDDMRGTP